MVGLSIQACERRNATMPTTTVLTVQFESFWPMQLTQPNLNPRVEERNFGGSECCC